MYSKSLLLACFGLWLSPAALAQATDRSPFPEPPPIEKEDSASPNVAFQRLAEVLEDRGSPRVALYWGEWLSSDIESQSQEVVQLDSRADMDGSGNFDPDRSDYWYLNTSSESQIRLIRRSETILERDLSQLATAQLWRVESAFIDRLASTGLAVVDPNFAIRRHAGRSSDESDRRRLETEVILEDIDYVLEVLGRYDAQTESGWLFRLRLTDVSRDARVIDVTTEALPPDATPVTYVASERGFQLAPADQPTAQQFGEELARQLAERLASIL